MVDLPHYEVYIQFYQIIMSWQRVLSLPSMVYVSGNVTDSHRKFGKARTGYLLRV